MVSIFLIGDVMLGRQYRKMKKQNYKKDDKKYFVLNRSYSLIMIRLCKTDLVSKRVS